MGEPFSWEATCGCGAVPPLLGHTVAVTGDRRADELTAHLRGLGADVLHGPVLRTQPPVAGDRALQAVTAALIADPPAYVVATTGIGVRNWLNAAAAWRGREPLLGVLRGSCVLARGPKVVGALSEAGIRPAFVAVSGRTAALVVHLVASGVEGMHVAVQLPAGPLDDAVAALRHAGARVTTVPVYGWTEPDDLEPARRLVRAVASGRVSAVVFTSRPAVRQVVSLAAREGVGEQFGSALRRRVLAACIGPATAEQLRALTGAAPLYPESAVLGALAPAVADGLRESGHRHVVAPTGRDILVQGRLVVGRGIEVMTSDREGAVLRRLTTPPLRMVGRGEIVRSVWGPDAVDDAVLDTTMARLRRRTRVTGLSIVTVAGRGYRVVGEMGACLAPPDTGSRESVPEPPFVAATVLA
jgi:uroporphyrinogen-III synthase